MIVAFIGQDEFEQTVPMREKISSVLEKLIVDDGADVFWFTAEGKFDDYCWHFVDRLKTRHPNIKRALIETGYEDNQEELPVLKLFYDKIISVNYLCQNKILAPYVRNRFMVGMCDVLVTYYDALKFKTPQIESSTQEAIKFAKRYKRRIINLFER